MKDAPANEADPFLTVLGLFRALEDVSDSDRDLPDPVVDELLDAAMAELDEQMLLSGWALVAAILRYHLLRHAREIGCSCGSLGWLETIQLHHFDQGAADE